MISHWAGVREPRAPVRPERSTTQRRKPGARSGQTATIMQRASSVRTKFPPLSVTQLAAWGEGVDATWGGAEVQKIFRASDVILATCKVQAMWESCAWRDQSSGRRSNDFTGRRRGGLQCSLPCRRAFPGRHVPSCRAVNGVQ